MDDWTARRSRELEAAAPVKRKKKVEPFVKVPLWWIEAGFLQMSPVLQQEIEGVTAHEVRLRGNVVLCTRAGNYRTVRGRTLLAAIIDEVAFLRDETSSMPDIETYRALLPALATTGGMLIGISTPYRRIGLLHQKHRDYFG